MTFSLKVRYNLLQIFLAALYILELFIKQINIAGIYLESLLSDNKLPIFIKLSLRFHSFRSCQKNLYINSYVIFMA